MRFVLFFVVATALCAILPVQSIDTNWVDTPLTTQLWKLTSEGNVAELETLIENNPNAVHMRSSDGRGPLWWAYEHQQKDVIDLLIQHGVEENARDADGKTASEMMRPEATAYMRQKQEENEKAYVKAQQENAQAANAANTAANTKYSDEDEDDDDDDEDDDEVNLDAKTEL